ncbi:O-antigen ligase family protein [Vibrio nereis]|uniref:O-antigen ligase family protein n=1 Tax=Vibrio nereis TaxID=693 RepID=UPI0024958778|nr:O-antigen ligase family protein [Vibrio nereis]
MKYTDIIKNSKTSDSVHFSLVIFPLVWLYAGMMWIPQGNKPLVVLVLLSFFSVLFIEGPKKLFERVRNNTWFWIVAISSIFAIASYQFHGYSSQEIRALLVALFFLFLCSSQRISLLNIQWLCVISSLSSFILSVIHTFYLDSGRGGLPTNAIPLATHQGFLALSLLGVLCVNFVGKNKPVILLSVLCLIFSMLVTESRGPILALALVSLIILSIFFLKGESSRYTKISMAIALASVVFLSFDFLGSRIDQTFIELDRIRHNDLDSSIGLRMQMYMAGWEVFKLYPMFGSGEIRIEDINHLGLTDLGMQFATHSHLHNNFIDKLATSGLLGFTLLSIFFIYPIYYAFKYSGKYYPIILYPTLFWGSLCLTDAPFRNGDTAVLYFISIGLFISAIKLESRNENTLLSKTPNS